MRPGPRRSLTQTEIIDAAFAQLEEKGFAGLSVRGVAGALGITPTALYTYFDSRNALLRGMVEHLLAQLELPDAASAGAVAADAGEPTGHDGDERTAAPASRPVDVDDEARADLLAVSLQLRELLTARPGALGLIMSGPLDGPAALRMNEHLLAVFTGAGLALDDAARAAYALQVYVLGSIALQSEGADAADGHPSASIGSPELWTAVADYPLTRQTGDVVAQYDSTEQFTWGVGRLLDGLLPR